MLLYWVFALTEFIQPNPTCPQGTTTHENEAGDLQERDILLNLDYQGQRLNFI